MGCELALLRRPRRHVRLVVCWGTQMHAAIAHPPHLAGICPMFTPSNYHNGWVYLGGAFQQWFNETWTSILARDTVDRYLKTAAHPEQDARIVP